MNKEIWIQHVEIYLFQSKLVSTALCTAEMHDTVLEITAYTNVTTLNNKDILADVDEGERVEDEEEQEEAILGVPVNRGTTQRLITT